LRKKKKKQKHDVNNKRKWKVRGNGWDTGVAGVHQDGGGQYKEGWEKKKKKGKMESPTTPGVPDPAPVGLGQGRHRDQKGWEKKTARSTTGQKNPGGFWEPQGAGGQKRKRKHVNLRQQRTDVKTSWGNAVRRSRGEPGKIKEQRHNPEGAQRETAKELGKKTGRTRLQKTTRVSLRSWKKFFKRARGGRQRADLFAIREKKDYKKKMDKRVRESEKRTELHEKCVKGGTEELCKGGGKKWIQPSDVDRGKEDDS